MFKTEPNIANPFAKDANTVVFTNFCHEDNVNEEDLEIDDELQVAKLIGGDAKLFYLYDS